MLIQDQRVAIANADPKALVATLAQSAVGFGIDADEVGEGRDTLAKFIERDLGELPDAGFTVDSKFQTYGEAQNHAWIALEIEVSAPGRATRHIAITELAVAMDKKWQVVAWQWAVPVPDATAEKLAILGTLPPPKSITDLNLAPKDVESAVRAAFASRAAFAEARSERPDGFNFGSAPGERITGGTAIKKLFGRIKAEIKVHDGMRIASGDMWDPAQKGAPYIAYAIANVDFTTKTRAATDLTQTFRVLAVLLKEGSEWKIVQTQWSHGGPIR
jgi:ketosteroid isomerase-like protein